jgi:branched-chain amino acid transport system permease protein
MMDLVRARVTDTRLPQAVVWITGVLLLTLPYVAAGDYVLHILILICVIGSLSLSMNLVLRMGQLSFAQAAFMGIGAYGSALLSMRYGLSPIIATIAGAVIASLIAALTGPIFLRIKGTYFVLLTFCFAQIVDLIFQDRVELFGGNNGLTGIPPYQFDGTTPASMRALYLAALFVLLVSYYVVRTACRSDFGIVLASLEENEKLSQSFGLSAIRFRIATYAISAFIAGLSGAFYAHYMSFINPSSFSNHVAVQALMINVVGGLSWPAGAIIGAVILVPLPELLRDAKQYQTLVYGLTVIAVLLFARDGLVGLYRQLTKGSTK